MNRLLTQIHLRLVWSNQNHLLQLIESHHFQLDHFLGAFIIYGFGILCSALCFVTEVLIWKSRETVGTAYTNFVIFWDTWWLLRNCVLKNFYWTNFPAVPYKWYYVYQIWKHPVYATYFSDKSPFRNKEIICKFKCRHHELCVPTNAKVQMQTYLST